MSDKIVKYYKRNNMLSSYDDKDVPDDKKKKIQTSTEIVDVPPPAYNETEEGPVSAGSTQLNKEELHHLFDNRNLAFVATLSKDGSPHVTPVLTEMVDDLILINSFEK